MKVMFGSGVEGNPMRHSCIVSLTYYSLLLLHRQINVAKVDASGKYTGENHTFALNGYIRDKGESDHALTKLYAEAVATEKKD